MINLMCYDTTKIAFVTMLGMRKTSFLDESDNRCRPDMFPPCSRYDVLFLGTFEDLASSS
jgi:hypothetical protein